MSLTGVNIILASTIASMTALMLFIPPVEATTISDDIGIMLGQTCVTMLKHNITSNCPSYDEIMVLHPDKSDQRISGSFEYIDGMYQRGKAMKNHEKFYLYDDADRRVWVDPPGNIRAKMSLIIIEPSLPEYKIIGQEIHYNGTMATYDVGHTRWLNPNCSEAVISAEDWILNLGDTMRVILADCDETISVIDTIKKNVFEQTEFDITTTYKWQLEQWYAEAKEKAKQYLLGGN